MHTIPHGLARMDALLPATLNELAENADDPLVALRLRRLAQSLCETAKTEAGVAA